MKNFNKISDESTKLQRLAKTTKRIGSVATSVKKWDNPRAVIMSTVALATMTSAETVGDAMANTPQPDQTTVELCEQDALNSYSFSPHSNTFKYIKRNGTNNRYVKWTVRATAMPTECDGVVQRSIGVQELIGTRKNHLVPNTTFHIVNIGNGAVSDQTYVQRTIHPYGRGELIQGIEDIIATPITGGQPAVGQHATSIVGTQK